MFTASGPLLAAGSVGDRFWAGYSGRTHAFAEEEWSPAWLPAPELMPLTLGSDGTHVFGLVPGTGGGLDLLVEAAAGFSSAGAFDPTLEACSAPQLFGDQPAIGALWLRPHPASAEPALFGAVF